MTQEDKELLLKDLCARLPYKVIASYYGSDEERRCYDTVEGIDVTCTESEVTIGQYGLHIDAIKPYLRPMSSMTEEEHIEYYQHIVLINSVERYDWLNANHFDYRGLIDKGLALEAPDGMYKIS